MYNFLKWKGWAGLRFMLAVVSLLVFAFIAFFLFALEDQQKQTRDALLDRAATANVLVDETWLRNAPTSWLIGVLIFNSGPAVAPQNDMKLELLDDFDLEIVDMEARGFGGQPLSAEPFLTSLGDIIVPNVPRLGRERSMTVLVNIAVNEACGNALFKDPEGDGRRLLDKISFGEPEIVMRGLQDPPQLPDECTK